MRCLGVASGVQKNWIQVYFRVLSLSGLTSFIRQFIEALAHIFLRETELRTRLRIRIHIRASVYGATWNDLKHFLSEGELGA